METVSQKKIERLITIANVLGNTNRVSVLFSLLHQGDDGVRIARELGISQQAVSAIIMRLVHEGLVQKNGYRRGVTYIIPLKTKTLIDKILSNIGEFESG